MKKHILIIFAVAAVLSLGGCAAESQPAKAAPPSAPAATSRAAGSNSLSTVTVGMTKSQVREIAGSPSDENQYVSGKGWIPFYFGNDARRATWYYKGQGRVVFADGNVFGGGGSNVVNVEVDPTESGVAR